MVCAHAHADPRTRALAPRLLASTLRRETERGGNTAMIRWLYSATSRRRGPRSFSARLVVVVMVVVAVVVAVVVVVRQQQHGDADD